MVLILMGIGSIISGIAYILGGIKGKWFLNRLIIINLFKFFE